MGNPAIILGDPLSILQLLPAGMKDPTAWTVTDSDIVAHFIQVHGQIVNSRWYASKVGVTIQGGKLLDSAFPDLEQFIFAAAYFRQLFAKRDRLLKEAVGRYCKFVDCQIREAWVRDEETRFETAVDAPAWPLTGHTVRQLFEAYLYGAGLLHKFPKHGDDTRTRFLQLHDEETPYKVMLALHGSLRQLANHFGALALVIHRDFAHWQKTYSLPAPDVRWHDRLFNLERRQPPADPAE